ncbi:hypothetical protein EJB05_07777 [Eragrostis curvula]|uniref:Uncharacterized protein n=1 Tax=Eragrostis curvula TaxID=38414 RepID=A0A5J9WJA8_9POAL|nr:hypothetical protein EJB05_07777 [Eragrostis curvula]
MTAWYKLTVCDYSMCQEYLEGHAMIRSSHLAAPLLVAAIIIAGAAAAPNDDTVADSCNAIRSSVNFDFCVARLRDVPGASSTDRRGHLLMAADLAATAGSTARYAAIVLLRGESDPAARDGLEACDYLYVAASLPALQFMRGYAEAGSWAAAKSLLMLTAQGGIGCEAALAGAPPVATKMTGVNGEFDKLNALATALLYAVS